MWVGSSRRRLDSYNTVNLKLNFDQRIYPYLVSNTPQIELPEGKYSFKDLF